MHTEAGGRRSVCRPVTLNFCFQKGGGGSAPVVCFVRMIFSIMSLCEIYLLLEINGRISITVDVKNTVRPLSRGISFPLPLKNQ